MRGTTERIELATLRHVVLAACCAGALCVSATCCRSDGSRGNAQHASTPTSERDSASIARPADTAGIAERPDSGSAAAAVAVIRGYYTAIDTHDYRRAYLAWEQRGAASGQSFDAFRSGFDSTVSVTATLGAPSRIEGAAGSRYVTVPVQITARTASGDVQHFQGTYTLRRAVVTGATPEQRTWHIYSAKVVAVR